ncbi:glycoside hydrolase [Ampelomyces quisqualis]|uniref:AA9 family lytic polysaccharide monooxygenase n=1 Tax=Ampelomyces quisqualis TaxID=50730 RepID=A0A6A5QSL8_AMPQU|nr:glycoside hydrolase [Ampelomyces quisqualis]
MQVKPGDKLTAEWHHTLDSKPETDKSDPIDPGHLGPIMVYLAKVDNALTTTVTGLKWFKIYEDGMDSSGEWAVTRLYNNKGKVDFALPSCVPAGQYLLRAELIALHAAANYPGAQFYMECAQINVQSSSATKRHGSFGDSAAPRRHFATRAGAFNPSYVSFPGAYSGSDPGVKFQLFWPKPTSYTIPGPRPLQC